MKKQKKMEKKNGVVLLIEDEEDTADLIRLHIEKSGMSVVHVRDGRQAVSIMEDILPPRAVLLDLVLPYLNGFELLKIIRAKAGWEQVPVMVVSGDSYSEVIKQMLHEGANDYIIKSWGVGVIHDRLRQMLEQVSTEQAA
jgi:DNA-binding response OmpR family regulator